MNWIGYFLKLFKMYEMLPSSCVKPIFSTWYLKYVCKLLPKLCSLGLAIVDSNPDKYLKTEDLKYYFHFYPGGTSLKSLLHYLQFINLDFDNRGWFKFDYGKDENLKRYNTVLPPKYNLNNIKNKIIIFHGNNDNLADSNSINQLLKDYPNLNIKKYLYDDFGHSSLFWARDNSQLKSDILQELNN